MLLKNESKNKIVISNLQVAKSFWARSKGLLGRSNLPETEALWIIRCNSIHTFFMQFAIDAVFVDRKLRVKKIVSDLRPCKLVLPVWGAQSVFELAAGSAQKFKIEVGDQLHVGT